MSVSKAVARERAAMTGSGLGRAGAPPPGRARPGGFARLGIFSFRHPIAVAAVWAAVVAAGIAGFARLPDVLRQGGLTVRGSDSDLARAEISRAFPSAPEDRALLVFTSPTVAPTDPAYRVVVERVGALAARVPGVVQVTTPYQGQGMIAGDGTSYAVIGLRGGSGTLLQAGRSLLAIARSIRGPVRVMATGSAPLSAELIDAAHADLAGAERVSLPIAGIMLLVAFGSLVAAAMPLAIAAGALLCGMGLLFLLAHVLDMSVLVENAASMMGLAVSIDYALFIVTRYREELAAGFDGAAALSRTMETAGRAVFFSGVTVVLSLAGAILVPVSLLRVMAIGPIVVIAVAVLSALTLVPALLRLAGGWIDRLRVPGLRPQTSGPRGLWARWAAGIMRRPVWFLVGGTAVPLLLAWPVLGMALGNPGTSTTPGDFVATRAARTVATAFGPGVLGPVLVVVRDPAGPEDPALAAGTRAFETLVRDDPQVRTVTGPAVGREGAGAAAVFTVVPASAPDAAASGDLVARIRDRIAPRAFGRLEVHVGGPAAENLDAKRALIGSIPRVYCFVIVVTFVLLLVAFASVAIPLKAILMNLLSVGAAFGVLVAVFQRGIGASFVGVSPLPYLDFITPLIVFTALFGLSMDYEVFLLSRMREHYAASGDNEAAVAAGLQSTARTITAAAAIMVAVFAAFVPTRLLAIKQIGLGLAVAIALDVTVIRLVLVPSMMRLLGRWNWWLPGWAARRLPRPPSPG